MDRAPSCTAIRGSWKCAEIAVATFHSQQKDAEDALVSVMEQLLDVCLGLGSCAKVHLGGVWAALGPLAQLEPSGEAPTLAKACGLKACEVEWE